MRKVTGLLSAGALLVLCLYAPPASATVGVDSDCAGTSSVARAAAVASGRDVIPCPGVRPGASISIKDGYGCTMNFLFEGSDDRVYAGTGGHCLIDGHDVEGQQTWRPGKGMETYDAEGNRIGESALWALGDGFDFALIRLDRGVKWDPQMCHFGGPTGIYNGIDDRPATVNIFSGLSPIGAVSPARTLVAATGFPSRVTVDTLGAALFGDSGAPAVLEDGRAVGLLFGVGFGFSGTPGSPGFMGGNVFVMRLAPQLKAAEKALHLDLRIIRAPDIQPLPSSRYRLAGLQPQAARALDVSVRPRPGTSDGRHDRRKHDDPEDQRGPRGGTVEQSVQCEMGYAKDASKDYRVHDWVRDDPGVGLCASRTDEPVQRYPDKCADGDPENRQPQRGSSRYADHRMDGVGKRSAARRRKDAVPGVGGSDEPRHRPREDDDGQADSIPDVIHVSLKG